MTELIERLIGEFDPSGEDAAPLDGRNDTKFTQIVRNLVSHREGTNSMFTKGYAIYHKERESIKITTAGKTFLDQVPDA